MVAPFAGEVIVARESGQLVAGADVALGGTRVGLGVGVGSVSATCLVGTGVGVGVGTSATRSSRLPTGIVEEMSPLADRARPIW